MSTTHYINEKIKDENRKTNKISHVKILSMIDDLYGHGKSSPGETLEFMEEIRELAAFACTKLKEDIGKSKV